LSWFWYKYSGNYVPGPSAAIINTDTYYTGWISMLRRVDTTMTIAVADDDWCSSIDSVSLSLLRPSYSSPSSIVSICRCRFINNTTSYKRSVDFIFGFHHFYYESSSSKIYHPIMMTSLSSCSSATGTCVDIASIEEGSTVASTVTFHDPSDSSPSVIIE